MGFNGPSCFLSMLLQHGDAGIYTGEGVRVSLSIEWWIHSSPSRFSAYMDIASSRSTVSRFGLQSRCRYNFGNGTHVAGIVAAARKWYCWYCPQKLPLLASKSLHNEIRAFEWILDGIPT